MMVSLIVAIANNGVIGSKNDLPWYLPADLRHFKEITMGHSVISGRKTFESVIARLGQPLPGRRNIMLTRNLGYGGSGADVVASLDEALELAKDEPEVFILGGAQVFAEALPQSQRIYLTEVHADIVGDVKFPDYDKNQWHEIAREDHQPDDKNQYAYSWVILERK